MPRGTDRYDEASRQGRLWTPREAPGLFAWFDAMDTGTLTIVSGAVSAWADKSGRGINLSQGTSGNRPAFSQSAFLGNPALDFVAASTQGLSGTISPTFTGSTIAAFAVALCDTAAAGQFGRLVSIDAGGNDYDNNSSSPLIQRSNGADYINVTRNFVESDYVQIVSNAYSIFCGYHDGSIMATGYNGDYTGFNGTPVASTGAFGATRLWIGRNGGGDPWDGLCGEVVMFSGFPSPAVRQTVEGYLAWKWWPRRDNPLIASHPFKNRPPLIGG